MKTDQVFHPRIELVYGVIIVDKYSFNIPNTTNNIFSTLCLINKDNLRKKIPKVCNINLV